MKPIKLFIFITCLIFSVAVSSFSNAQLSYERILNAQDEPQNWLTYNGGYMAQRHSLLDQINKNNVENLELKWVLQNQVLAPGNLIPSSSMALCMLQRGPIVSWPWMR